MDPLKHAPLRINDIRSKYKIIDKVGKGTYGTVFKVQNLEDHKYYAIKKFENTEAKLQVEGFPITALRCTSIVTLEISLLKQLNHPNIVNLK
jgi:serine/threonine protein kinase